MPRQKKKLICIGFMLRVCGPDDVVQPITSLQADMGLPFFAADDVGLCYLGGRVRKFIIYMFDFSRKYDIDGICQNVPQPLHGGSAQPPYHTAASKANRLATQRLGEPLMVRNVGGLRVDLQLCGMAVATQPSYRTAVCGRLY
jgi:hypothetical protein